MASCMGCGNATGESVDIVGGSEAGGAGYKDGVVACCTPFIPLVLLGGKDGRTAWPCRIIAPDTPPWLEGRKVTILLL